MPFSLSAVRLALSMTDGARTGLPLSVDFMEQHHRKTLLILVKAVAAEREKVSH